MRDALQPDSRDSSQQNAGLRTQLILAVAEMIGGESLLGTESSGQKEDSKDGKP